METDPYPHELGVLLVNPRGQQNNICTFLCSSLSCWSFENQPVLCIVTFCQFFDATRSPQKGRAKNGYHQQQDGEQNGNHSQLPIQTSFPILTKY
jgi:hypothetical protein